MLYACCYSILSLNDLPFRCKSLDNRVTEGQPEAKLRKETDAVTKLRDVVAHCILPPQGNSSTLSFCFVFNHLLIVLFSAFMVMKPRYPLKLTSGGYGQVGLSPDRDTLSLITKTLNPYCCIPWMDGTYM